MSRCDHLCHCRRVQNEQRANKIHALGIGFEELLNDTTRGGMYRSIARTKFRELMYLMAIDEDLVDTVKEWEKRTRYE